MLISKLKTEGFVYYNLHTEQVMISNYFNDNSDLGIYEDLLVSDTIEKVLNDLEDDCKNIILDFDKIQNISQNNINKKFHEYIKVGYKFVLLNVREDIINDFGFNVITNDENICEDEFYRKFNLFSDDIESLKGKIKPRKIFTQSFENIISNYIIPYGNPHTSSFVYLHSYVDLKSFISNEKKMFLFSMYQLSIMIKEECINETSDDIILVCQSLNSSLIVSILSNLLKLDILILDKIGPINKLYSRLDKNISDKKKYVIISDLVCLGTEVKIVKNLIQFLGGTYLRNASLIKIETLNSKHIKKPEATIAVFSINRSNNARLNYKITTNLEDF
ncbi:hypothetical protein [Chryseobacterium nepalense]|uniref:Phosphoribosyltransferase domain-containing protein n=1 Tax=Chryseobacterium nepalense TaxID=1854498 RepID=A0ABY4K4L2_9FLAO|nr:hypothetical protein [Chryseobacterium nepalense]UPQ75281.1 hypothetical protein M0D58_14670 [Chryseobacterium nepalense]